MKFKVKKLNEEIYGPNGEILKTDAEIDADLQKSSMTQEEKIQSKLDENPEYDELPNDILELFKSWTKK